MLIKTARFELEMFGWLYLHWFHVDIGKKRYTIYRDLDMKLAHEVADRPEPDHVRAKRYFMELEERAPGPGGADRGLNSGADWQSGRWLNS